MTPERMFWRVVNGSIGAGGPRENRRPQIPDLDVGGAWPAFSQRRSVVPSNCPYETWDPTVLWGQPAVWESQEPQLLMDVCTWTCYLTFPNLDFLLRRTNQNNIYLTVFRWGEKCTLGSAACPSQGRWSINIFHPPGPSLPLSHQAQFCAQSHSSLSVWGGWKERDWFLITWFVLRECGVQFGRFAEPSSGLQMPRTNKPTLPEWVLPERMEDGCCCTSVRQCLLFELKWTRNTQFAL